jgi:hypothetical protein
MAELKREKEFPAAEEARDGSRQPSLKDLSW